MPKYPTQPDHDPVIRSLETVGFGETVCRLLADDSVSFRLKSWIREFQRADPVDALGDARILKQLCEARCNELDGPTQFRNAAVATLATRGGR